MTATKLVPASTIILRVCRDLNYSRSHVAKIFRELSPEMRKWNPKSGRWMVTPGTEKRLKAAVRENSGRRYKLGEKGRHGIAA